MTESAGYRQELPPPPVSNPPWPYAVWNEGGTELIGDENMYYERPDGCDLLRHERQSLEGQPLRDLRLDRAGRQHQHLQLGFNKVTGTGGNYSGRLFLPAQHVQLDQAALVFRAHAG